MSEGELREFRRLLRDRLNRFSYSVISPGAFERSIILSTSKVRDIVSTIYIDRVEGLLRAIKLTIR